ncbi:Zinc-type alcohol dehydrogenase-like protein [Escovopsis weberi]|uniref:Dehydrogenase FUB6 n=1 Tax=Escovopsis weberi TaxID=150374 RepID=A0A0M8MTT6_ESCWE|nr:Zinc-type alcohol dehydrogenase-like protein [Escovopsis weberi]
MAPVKSLVFKKIPSGIPVAGEHIAVETRHVDIDTTPDGGLVLEILYAALDPYQRGRMRDPRIPLYCPAIPLGDNFDGHTIAKVFKSGTSAFQVGDVVHAHANIAEYARIEDPSVARVAKVHNPYNLPLEMFLVALGLPGCAAWTGMHEFAKPQAGEVIFISSAASAVGSLAGQLAKRMGCTVIGSTGSDEKLEWLIKDLGFDAGFNYKNESPMEALARLAPNGINIYFDHVGGEQLDAALYYMVPDGRIVACGMIPDYSLHPTERTGVKNLLHIVVNRLTMKGYIVGEPGYPEYRKDHQETFQKWLAEGSLKTKLSMTVGMEPAAQTFVDMLVGNIVGKAVLKMK